MSNARWTTAMEAFAVFGLIMAYIWRFRFTHPASWLAILAVVIVSHIARGETPSALGFRVDNLARCFAVVLPLVLPIAALLVAAALVLGTLRATHPGEAVLGILLYWAWGLFQQYLLNGYFVRRLDACSPGQARDYVPLLAAGLFALAHLPNGFLMIVTWFGGFLAARVYLRCPNLYALGFAHGLLGFVLTRTIPDSITGRFYIGPRLLS